MSSISEGNEKEKEAEELVEKIMFGILERGGKVSVKIVKDVTK